MSVVMRGGVLAVTRLERTEERMVRVELLTSGLLGSHHNFKQS
jgi:hypothetical protein